MNTYQKVKDILNANPTFATFLIYIVFISIVAIIFNLV